MGRDRDDVALNGILSQLSRDGNVLEEVRKIALRSLKAQGPNRDNQRTPLVPQGAEHSKIGDTFTSERSSVGDETLLRNQGRHKAARQAPSSENEELAFTVSKDSDTYRNILSTAQWYRDSFLMGSSFADKMSDERKVIGGCDEKMRSSGEKMLAKHQSAISQSNPSTAMGHPLLLSAAESYIRSISAVELIRPYATWIVSEDGPMAATATQSMAQSIPLAQSLCDWSMRENALWVLKDEEWKEFAKSITTEYVDRSYRDC